MKATRAEALPGEPAITDELVREHGLRPQEYDTIKSILQREPTFTTGRSCRSADPGLDPRHQINTPRSGSSRKGATVSRPPQALTVTTSKSHTWNMARA